MTGTSGGNHTVVLVVEDEDALRALTRRILVREGYEVIEAATPAEAIDACANGATRPALLLTDVVMPGMSGVDLRDRLREIEPGLRVLFMSGYTANVMDIYGLDPGEALLDKPFDSRRLLAAVAGALERFQRAGH